MSKQILSRLVIFLVLLVLALVLNPSAEKHHAAIKAAVSAHSPLAGLLGLGTLAAIASDYHSIGIASWTRIDERIISIGALGYVHVQTPEEKKQ